MSRFVPGTDRPPVPAVRTWFADMAYDFTGKVAIVTGACNGIGRFTTIALLEAGASVVAADITPCPRTLELFRTRSDRVQFIETDVAENDQVRDMVRRTKRRFNRLDIAVNNAGLFRYQTLTHKWREDQWDRMMNVNLKGVWLCMKHELPVMLAQGEGAIVNVSSVAGLVGCEGMSGYSASKHGVIGLTKSAALEYAERGIRINAVCPGSVVRPSLRFPRVFTEEKTDDGRHPMGRFCTGEEVAQAILWLCSDASSFTTGHALAVDGGWSAR